MIWIILSIVFILLGVLCIVVKGEEWDFEWMGVGIMLIVGVVILCVHIDTRIDWIRRYELYKNYHILIKNEIEKIGAMRKTYYNPPKNIKFNIDMVNKELSQQINQQIKILTDGINNYNRGLFAWKVSYKYRFWGACYTKPEGLKIIKLSDYKF